MWRQCRVARGAFWTDPHSGLKTIQHDFTLDRGISYPVRRATQRTPGVIGGNEAPPPPPHPIPVPVPPVPIHTHMPSVFVIRLTCQRPSQDAELKLGRERAQPDDQSGFYEMRRQMYGIHHVILALQVRPSCRPRLC